jgi:hypothetical protein
MGVLDIHCELEYLEYLMGRLFVTRGGGAMYRYGTLLFTNSHVEFNLFDMGGVYTLQVDCRTKRIDFGDMDKMEIFGNSHIDIAEYMREVYDLDDPVIEKYNEGMVYVYTPLGLDDLRAIEGYIKVVLGSDCLALDELRDGFREDLAVDYLADYFKCKVEVQKNDVLLYLDEKDLKNDQLKWVLDHVIPKDSIYVSNANIDYDKILFVLSLSNRDFMGLIHFVKRCGCIRV